MTIKISALWNKVQEIAEREPDTLYSQRFAELTGKPDDDALCEYAINGQGGCLVGVALFELGLDPEVIAGFDNLYGCGSEVIATVVRERGDVFDIDSEQDLFSLEDAQSKQDSGSTWGAAVC